MSEIHLFFNYYTILFLQGIIASIFPKINVRITLINTKTLSKQNIDIFYTALYRCLLLLLSLIISNYITSHQITSHILIDYISIPNWLMLLLLWDYHTSTHIYWLLTGTTCTLLFHSIVTSHVSWIHLYLSAVIR